MKERKHSQRPKTTKLESSWGCRCGTINLGTDATCKRIRIDRGRLQAKIYFAELRHEAENKDKDGKKIL